MDSDKLNSQISYFLNSIENKNVQKTATLGNFIDVKDIDSAAKIAAMTKEMLDLPKYQPIIDKLKVSFGVVNFVTHDEYQPLIELMLKRVFPSSTNDIFSFPTMRNGIAPVKKPTKPGEESRAEEPSYYSQIDLGQEYFVAPEFFSPNGNIMQGDARAVIPSRNRLENLLMGSKVKITRKWLESELGFTKADIEDLLGREPTEDERRRMIDDRAANPDRQPDRVSTLTPLGENVIAYELALRDIEDRYNKHIAQLDREIFEHNMGDDSAFPNPEDFEKKKRQRSLWVARKRMEIEALNESAVGASIGAEKVTGIVDRNNDGFINFSPQNSIKILAYELGKKVLTYLKEKPKMTQDQERSVEGSILGTSLNLKRKLEEAYTSDPRLRVVQEQWIAFLGNGTHQDFSRIINSIMGTYTQLQYAYQRIQSQHGKVLILDDFDKSALCTRTANDGKIKVEDVTRSLFVDFVGKNSGNLERDETILSQSPERGKIPEERGKRVIVVVSSERISNLPASSVIEMDVAPVDRVEAEIIVRNTLKQHVIEAQRSVKRKLYREISDKYGDLKSSAAQAEANKIKTYLEDQADVLGNVGEESRKKMVTHILGLGQKEAINLVRMAVAHGIERTGEDFVKEELKFNEERIINILREETEGKTSIGVKGLTKMIREIEFEDYAYEKGTEWSTTVGTIKKNIDYFKFLRGSYDANKKRIRDIDRLLKNSEAAPSNSEKRLGPDIIKSLVEEKNDLIGQNKETQNTLEMESSNQIPHFFILYGDPGVGKCLGRGTKVLMFDGNKKNVEDVVAGDLLMGPDSKPRNVLTTTCGIGPLYRVSQNLGEDYVCNDAHILSLQSTDKPVDQDPVFISAEDFCKKNKEWKHRHKGWKTGVEFKEQDPTIDPYWLGLWLGAGLSGLPSIMVAHKDKEIADWLQKWAEDNHMFIRKEKQHGCSAWHFTDVQGSGGCVHNNVKTKLRDLNLLQNKHIPEIYWKNSSRNRLELLAGLIDSDGYKCQSGSIQFTSVNKNLAKNVLDLARSLGFRVTFSEGIKGIKKLNYKVKAYTVTIGGTLSRIPSRFSRKQGHDNLQKKSLRYGIEVNPIGEGEYFGFTIDGDRQFLLGDFTVTHNTVWGSALASLLGYTLYKIDISDQKNMWVGNTEENCRKLLNFLKASQETVFLMDEIDRQLAMGGAQEYIHETTKTTVAKFLEFFGNKSNDEAFIKNKIYFIMTTNHIEQVDLALQARAQVKVHVERPQSIDAYQAILRSAIKKLMPRFPSAPINTINWDYVAQVLSKKEVDFRHLEQMMEKSFSMDKSWQITMEMFTKGAPNSLSDLQGLGLPLTTENMLEICDLIASGDTHGVTEIAAEKAKKIKAMLDPYITGQKKYNTIEIVNPYTKKPQKTLQFPEEITKVMRGEGGTPQSPPAQLASEGWEYTKSTDPATGLTKTELKPKIDPAKEMDKLKDTGFQEQPLIELEPEKTKEEASAKKKKEEMGKKFEKLHSPGQTVKEKEDVSSSTDYFYDYLQKQGLVQDNKIVVTKKVVSEKKREEKPVVIAKNTPAVLSDDEEIDDMAKKGVFYFGGLIVAPMNEKVPPQQIRRFKR